MSTLIIVFASLLVTNVVDGDTFDYGGDRVRIANIDTPEISRSQCPAEMVLGMAAKRRLESLLRRGKIDVIVGDPADGRTKDRYGRTLATVKVDGQDVGEILIGEGLAKRWTGKRARWC